MECSGRKPWKFLEVYGSFWKFLEVYGSFWNDLGVLSSFGQVLASFGSVGSIFADFQDAGIDADRWKISKVLVIAPVLRPQALLRQPKP